MRRHCTLTLTLIGICLLFSAQHTRAQTKGEPVWLSVAPEKSDYFLGEIVTVRFAIGNSTETALAMDVPGVESGSLRLFISEDGEKYREYVGPYWGLNYSPSKSQVELKPGDQFQTSATLLFNNRVATWHLNEPYAQEIRSQRIDTDYGFAKAGRYFVKAVLELRDSKTPIESSSVELLISEPVREDGLAWEILRGHPAAAYFLHAGELPLDEESAKQLRAGLTEILERYPSCIYATRIKENLDQLSK